MLRLIKNIIKETLIENLQLADKVYFKTNRLTDEDRNIILNITNGDDYTKVISDIYYYFKLDKLVTNQNLKRIKELYIDLKTYNKNVFPIDNFDIYNIKNTNNLILALEKRRGIIEELNKLPSFAKRNLKTDIRQVRDASEIISYYNDFLYFMSFFSQLNNRDEETKLKIIRKMFIKDTTLNKLLNFVEEKQNLIGGNIIKKEDIINLSKNEDFLVLYNKNNKMIIEVFSPEGIKKIGCNSLWCFTYGKGLEAARREWKNYSYNDIVYVIIDFNQNQNNKYFMHVLTKPLINQDGDLIHYNEDSYPLYDMTNENLIEPFTMLEHLFGKNFKNIIRNFLNFDE